MTIGILDKDGLPQQIEEPIGVGRKAAAASKSNVLCTEDFALLTAIDGHVDGLETLVAATNTALALTNGYVDGIETLLGAIDGHVDGLETLAAAATPAGENHIGAVGGHGAVVGGTLTRGSSTTAYAAGQHIKDTSLSYITVAVARVNAGTGTISRARLSTDKTGLTGTEVFRLHIFKNAPGTVPADYAAISGGISGVAALWLGAFDITLDMVFSDGAKGIGVPRVGGAIMFDAAAASMNLYCVLEARGAYTPANGEVFTIALEADRD